MAEMTRPQSRAERPVSEVSGFASQMRPQSEVSDVHSRTRSVRHPPSDSGSRRPPTPPSEDEERHTEVDSAINSRANSRRPASETSRIPRAADRASSNRFENFLSQTNSMRPDVTSRRDDVNLVHEKQNVLMDISRLKLQGVQFSKEYSLDDSLDDMQYEIRRHMLHLEETNNIKMMRDGMQMICTGIEMLNGRMQLLELNGWASDVCSDMSKYDPALSKLYRKYWRKSQASSPEMEIATGVLMSMGMYHFKRKLSSRMFPGPQRPSATSAPPPSHAPRRRPPSPAASDTSSEDLPP